MDRLPGRYNLHRLGWKAFEDLVIEVNRTILGATVTPFRVGADEGRDGFFKGQLAGEYLRLAPGGQSVVVQCKHTSAVNDGLKLSDVVGEKRKIAQLAKNGECHIFALFSNRRVGAEDERIIRTEFESIAGVARCCVFGEEWIESHIDGNFRLLRRVPRLFGIGDLSQILSNNVSSQTRLILEEMKLEQAVFVPTPSYRDAVAAMEQHGLVVLVGPPASGKSAIALSLCMVLGAEDEDLEVLKIETAEQFTTTWSAEDTKKLFWVEDFFGETTLDDYRVKPWSSVFDKILVAHNAGNKFIFTCRDYILKDAHAQVRKKKLDMFEARSVFVRVDNLTTFEKERILYNHVKMGDLEFSAKRGLKKHLPAIASLSGFTPEIARRIGTARFHKNLSYDLRSLTKFVNEPVQLFSEVIHDLGTAEQAAIAYLLLSNNALADPVTTVPPQVQAAYGANVADVRHALETLRGSLTKLNILGNRRLWQVHHPSMIDAMHRNLRDHGAMLDLFVEGAPVNVILRDCSTVEAEHRLFVPEALYDRLLARVFEASPVDAATFFANQNDAFLRHVLAKRPDELARVMGDGFEFAGRHRGLLLLVQIRADLGEDFDPGRKALEHRLEDALWSYACIESIYSDEFANPLDMGIVRQHVMLYASRLEPLVHRLAEHAKSGSQSPSDADDMFSHIKLFRRGLEEVAKQLLSPDEYKKLARHVSTIFYGVEDDLQTYIGGWESYLEDQADDMRHGIGEPDVGAESGIFADVDK